MEYRDLIPEPALGLDTMGVHMMYDALNETDNSILLQVAGSYQRAVCPGSNGLLTVLAESLTGDMANLVAQNKSGVENACQAVLEFITKDFDLRYETQIVKEHTFTIDVPKKRKVGLFKTEEYIDRETRTETSTVQETIVYKGWLLDRLYRQEGPELTDRVFIDYCMSPEGRLCAIVSRNDPKNADPHVMSAVFYSPAILANRFANVYVCASGGAIGALDAVIADPNSPQRNIHVYLDDDYFLNFPIQIDDLSQFPYPLFEGILRRLPNLLDDNGKYACAQKYEWMKPVLYPAG